MHILQLSQLAGLSPVRVTAASPKYVMDAPVKKPSPRREGSLELAFGSHVSDHCLGAGSHVQFAEDVL